MSTNEQIGPVWQDPFFTPERYQFRLVDFWPKPPSPNRIDHLPDAVAKAFAAAERNFPIAGMEEAAGGSYGRAIDLAIKLIDPTLKGTLYARIEALAKAHRLTPALATWAHEIRELRNEALHEVESLDREDLAAIRGLTEMVLRYLFDLPGILAERKAQSKAA